jgi:hypothetical protein
MRGRCRGQPSPTILRTLTANNSRSQAAPALGRPVFCGLRCCRSWHRQAPQLLHKHGDFAPLTFNGGALLREVILTGSLERACSPVANPGSSTGLPGSGSISRDGEICPCRARKHRHPAHLRRALIRFVIFSYQCRFGALTWLGLAGLLDPPPRNQIRLTSVKVGFLALLRAFWSIAATLIFITSSRSPPQSETRTTFRMGNAA